MLNTMRASQAAEWGRDMALIAQEWAEELVTQNQIPADRNYPERLPHLLMLVFDANGILQAWQAVWSPTESANGRKHFLRIVKAKPQSFAAVTDTEIILPMMLVEQHIRTIGKHKRHWLKLNEATNTYENFK